MARALAGHSWQRRPLRAGAVLLAAALVTVVAPAVPAVAGDGPVQEFTISDPRITESSGLAASTAHPGVYWTHNDSDDGPYVYAVDGQGRTVATVTMRGIKPRDVEAVSLGPDGQLYVADIGDNLDGTWPEVWIYRFAEPADLRDQSVDVVRYRVRYEDGPRNAEALMVHPVTGRVYIASKREKGAGLYEGPQTLSATAVNTFRRVSEVPWVTDGGFSPDGTRLLLRGYFWATMYRWPGAGAPEALGDVSLPFQRQGESATFAADGRSVLFGSEGRSSPVWRVALKGEQLPDTVRPSAAAGSSPSAGASAGAPAGASAGADGSPQAAAPAGQPADSDSGGGVTLLVVVAVVVALAGGWRKKRGGGASD
ncbi:WD40 repeat domain-containing protein [Kitasatospora sp. NPDC057223]|uniref:WD40 repeat domain-containing protein n=1 Tax=Kitasatospora sp. NPDC057223 TaxID=3346055 RepID=UPI00362B21C5